MLLAEYKSKKTKIIQTKTKIQTSAMGKHSSTLLAGFEASKAGLCHWSGVKAEELAYPAS